MIYAQSKDFWTCHIPGGTVGTAAIRKFTVSDHGAFMNSMSGDWIRAGDYTALSIAGSGLVMSDTPKEYRDHSCLFRHAKGRVLVNGLGLGCCLNVLRHDPEVESITVIEINPDVISLVGPHFIDPKVTIIHGDAMTWKSPRGIRYNAVWHDIWPAICADNIPQMMALHRRYGGKSEWQGSWARSECEYHKSKEKKNGHHFYLHSK